ncbi:MAG: NADH-quinone oxidoreductase subunit N [Vicinamibacteria bacterium]|nr:NADH-quinone oxidoreductase subunit N [Vicinamibacteria bacterium]
MSVLLALLPVWPASIAAAAAIMILLTRGFAPRRADGAAFYIALSGLITAMAATLVVPRHADLNAGVWLAGQTVVMDALAFGLHLLLIGAALLVVLLSRAYIQTFQLAAAEQYALMLLALVGMLGLTTSADLVAFFIAIEILSIALYVLAGSDPARKLSIEAALKYFVTGAFASAFLLYGIALLYAASGRTTLAGIAGALSSQAAPGPLIVVAIGLIVTGLGFKVAAVPFHMWAPDVYEGAPTHITVYMATGVKVAAFAALLRITAGPLSAATLAAYWRPALLGLAVLSMVLGNLWALAQDNLKRMLAYSSIAHAGYLLVAFSASSAAATEAAAFYLCGYAAANLAAFGALIALARDGREVLVYDDLAGLGERRPALAAVLVAAMLSLTGVPLTAGFTGKFMLFGAAIGAGHALLAVIGVLMSVVSAGYYLRVIITMYMREGAGGSDPARLAWPMRAALALAVLVILYLGILPGAAMNWARWSGAVLR